MIAFRRDFAEHVFHTEGHTGKLFDMRRRWPHQAVQDLSQYAGIIIRLLTSMGNQALTCNLGSACPI